VVRKIKWRKGKVSYKYYQADTIPEFEITDHGHTGLRYLLSFRCDLYFKTLKEAKQWAEDFREWKIKQRNK